MQPRVLFILHWPSRALQSFIFGVFECQEENGMIRPVLNLAPVDWRLPKTLSRSRLQTVSSLKVRLCLTHWTDNAFVVFWWLSALGVYFFFKFMSKTNAMICIQDNNVSLILNSFPWFWRYWYLGKQWIWVKCKNCFRISLLLLKVKRYKTKC